LTIFGLCIPLLLALIIGSAWLPRSWNNSVFVLFTIFISWLATTMFYEGFLYGRWELNALMNVIEELEIYRNQLEVKNRRLSNDGSWNSASLTEDGDR
jgi:sphingomyelin phosphodiesterase 2